MSIVRIEVENFKSYKGHQVRLLPATRTYTIISPHLAHHAPL